MKTSLNLIFLLVGLTTFSQIQELKNNDWYLDYVLINGNSSTPPTNQEFPYIILNFNDNDLFVSTYCNNLYGGIEIQTDFYTFLDGPHQTLQVCSSPGIPGLMPFEYQYFDFFFTDQTQPFYYDIVTETNGDKTLTITSASGDEAVYSNQQPLSTQENTELTFRLYPNPVKSNFRVQTANILEIKKVLIYNLTGNKVLTFDKSATYNISNLPKGVYFVKIKGENSIIEKIIKE